MALDQLKWALQALAIPAVDQARLFPEWVVVADELALDIDRWESTIHANYGEELSQPQAERLLAVARKLDSMSRDGADFDADLRGVEALSSSSRWAVVRLLAPMHLRYPDGPWSVPQSVQVNAARRSFDEAVNLPLQPRAARRVPTE